MGNTMAREKGPQAATEVGPPQMPDVPNGPDDGPDSTTKEPPFNHVKPGKQKKRSICAWWCDAVFVILCIIALLKALAEICVSVSGAISTRLFSTEQSGRMVGMVLLALLAAVTISILIYALIAVFKKQAKPLHAAALVLLITAILQAVVVGLAVRNSPHDRQVLERSMQESFDLAREENPRHVQLWAATQHDLTCCGLDSPYDYRSKNLPDIFPPNVPIACCLSYDSSRSDLVQERDREMCKARRMYHTEGCREAVFDVVKTTSDLVLGLTISLMILEIILSILAAILHKRNKKRKTSEKGKVSPEIISF